MKTLIDFTSDLFFRKAEALLGKGIVFHAVAGLLIFILVLAAGRVLKFLLNTVGRRIIVKTENELDDKILETFIERLLPITAISATYFCLRELSNGLTAANTTFLKFLAYSNATLYVLMAVVLTALAVRIVDIFVRHALRAVAQKESSNFDQAFAPLVNRMVNAVVAVVAIIIVLDHFGQNVSSMLALLSVGSLAIGLAAQDTISNMISGFVIMLDRPFRIGDRVKIPTGEEGDVFEIGIRSTKILDFDNNLIIVPNSDFLKTRVVNYSYPASAVRVVVDVNVAYGSDVAKVKNILLALARTHPNVLKTPAPEVSLMKLGDSALHFKLFCRVDSFKVQFATGEKLRIQAYDALNKAKIGMAVAQHVVHIKERKS